MLIISRKAGESFLVGDNIEITVFDIGADRIRVGIKAPADIPILRKEIMETREENVRASNTTTKDKLRDLNTYLKNSTAGPSE
ncbi:MAG: carbon storage regulator [Oscillospiraceae bacterium]|nr:carbon storage regulator [Oscillospiraceae bacterium]